MSHIFLLAVASAFYPLLLAAVLLMLDTERPAPLLAGYLAGGAIVSIGLGVAILFAFDRSGAVSSSHKRTTSPAVDIAAGALAVLVAVAMASGWDRRLRGRKEKPDAPTRDPWSKRVLAGGSPALAFVVGMVFSLPSFYYLAALEQIAERYHTSATAFALILAFNVIQFALIEVPLVGYLFSPERTRVRVGEFNQWFGSHLRQIGEIVALAIGIYLIVRGIVHLVQ